jgi:hypothetical protein
MIQKEDLLRYRILPVYLQKLCPLHQEIYMFVSVLSYKKFYRIYHTFQHTTYPRISDLPFSHHTVIEGFAAMYPYRVRKKLQIP